MASTPHQESKREALLIKASIWYVSSKTLFSVEADWVPSAGACDDRHGRAPNLYDIFLDCRQRLLCAFGIEYRQRSSFRASQYGRAIGAITEVVQGIGDRSLHEVDEKSRGLLRMSLSLVDKPLNLFLIESVHELASFRSNVRLRVGVKHALDMDLVHKISGDQLPML